MKERDSLENEDQEKAIESVKKRISKRDMEGVWNKIKKIVMKER